MEERQGGRALVDATGAEVHAAARQRPRAAEVGRALKGRVQETPWAAVAIALGVGYVLGGGFFSRPTRWLARASLGLLAAPAVRARVQGLLNRLRAEPAAAPF